MSRARRPLCEVCNQEPAFSFSWFADRDRPYAPRSGTWKFTGGCTSDTERYWLRIHGRHGFFSSVHEQQDWLRHLSEKTWFNPVDFAAMVARFEVAREGHAA